MNNSNPIQTDTITIPAMAGKIPGSKTSQLAGKLFGAIVASQPFRMSFDGGGQFDMIQGGIVPVDKGFQQITFFNFTAAEIVVQYFVGVPGITIIPTNSVKEFTSYPKGTDLTGASALAAGATKDFSGLDGVNVRRQITVQNRDNGGGVVEVWDQNNNALAVVDPNTPPWTVTVSGLIRLKNPGVNPLSRVIVGEIFFTS